MEEKSVPYIVHESEVSRLERVIKRLWTLVIIIFIALILTNLGWLYYEMQFEDIVVSQDVETGTGNAIVMGTGDIYGESKTDCKSTETQDWWR